MVLALAAAAQAQAYVSFPGGADISVTSPDNDFAPGIEVLLGREIQLDTAARVTFTAFFSEAKYKNAFLTIGDTKFSDNIVTGDAYTRDFEAGLLPFSFFVADTGKSIVNGGNQAAWQAGNGDPYFLVTPPTIGEDAVEKFYIALNDDGSLIDEDYDDYVIGVTVEGIPVKDVPEPAPAMLLGLGLIGIGLTRLKRRVS
jgi:hypothetical protein